HRQRGDSRADCEKLLHVLSLVLVEPHPVDFELGRSKSSSVEVVQLNRHVPRGHLRDISVVRVEPLLSVDIAGQASGRPLEPENVPLGEIHAAVLELLLLLRSLSGVVHKRLGALLTWSAKALDRKSTRLNSSHVKISYAVF